MWNYLILCALLSPAASAQFGPANGSAYGPWALDMNASKSGWFTDASKGSLIVYPNGLLFLFLDPNDDPYGFSYTLESGKGCVPLGHIPGARCDLTIEPLAGKVSIQSPSGAATTISWQLSANAETLTTEHTRSAQGEKSISKLVWRKPAPSASLQPIRPPQRQPRSAGPTADAVQEAVRKAVVTISTCAEGDSRIADAMRTLRDLSESTAVPMVATYLDDDRSTIRRSAIYILTDGPYHSIDVAIDQLKRLCKHSEDYTRGMAALALGAHQVRSSEPILIQMAASDASPYARRAAACALGQLGDPAALPALEKVAGDPNPQVAGNARAAIEMLRSTTKP